MTWLSQGIIDDLGAVAASHEAAAERAGHALETHRKAAFAARDDLHRHRGLAAEARFLLTIAHGAAPVPQPGQIRELDDERDGLGLAIGDLRMALPNDAPAEQFGRLAESMRALYAAAHVVALHADGRARALAQAMPVPEPDRPGPVPRAYASLVGNRVRVEGADGSSHVGVLSSVEGGQITLLDADGVPFAWPPLDDVVSVRPVPPGENGDRPVPPNGSPPRPREGAAEEPPPAAGPPAQAEQRTPVAQGALPAGPPEETR
ncbi:hypothetical protein E1200_27885 [Actinomadura sp. GC306]|uniref:hypothetical protein n=1 Tax=Actinomadura sp. GC306 TaxID=2530367 RepID=UPI00104AA31B|nr:hypothetical protein [Actinomadura sp. GC306]TDC61843.1 hypothetical protein E1200_27885 [Actinomadura sp. GC306]